MSETAPEPFVTLELPVDVDLPDARLRLGAALVTLPLAISLLFVDVLVVRAFGVAALVACVYWFRAARRARREADGAPRRALVLAPERLALLDGSGERSIAWIDVESVATDDAEENVVVRSCAGDELSIRPGYGKLGLEPLLARIEYAWRASATGSDLGARTPDRG